MKKLKSYFAFLLLLILFLCSVVFMCFNIYSKKIARAETATDEVGPYGLFAMLSISLSSEKTGENKRILTSVRNDFTLFPSMVQVYVQLYSSDTYRDSYVDMHLMSQEYIGDLDQGQMITASAPIGGVKKFWKGRAYYKVDSQAWKEIVTETMQYDTNGYLIL